MPAMLAQLGQAVKEARLGLAELFAGIEPDGDPERARLTGTVYQAMLTGFLSQWLLDPASALSGREVSTALRVIVS
ncbi:hypothetical protein ABGB18_42215 [Nonomuraea sp. B12E4]|uniref:hypothetical protein n=1 Tax=Nonomuraea sp. B12E4 TaxID=3153564 RepID=UPI00325F7105